MADAMDLGNGLMGAPQPPVHDFAAGDVVLAFHGQLLYEAKVLRVEGRPAVKYEVHYQGWKMSWNEVVPRDQVLEHNDLNLRVAHQLLSDAKERQQRAAALAVVAPTVVQHAEAPVPVAAPPPSRPRSGVAGKKGDPPSLFVMPATLKRVAVDDWEWVTKEQALVTLPRDPNVAQVLQRWEQSTRKGGGEADTATGEVCASLMEYFDALLPTMLLYRFERLQFETYFRAAQEKAGDPPPRPSTVYGAEHLLRLFVKLPFLLDRSQIEPAVLKSIAERVNDLMEFISRSGRTMLLPVYKAAEPEYLERIRQG
jgi:mortality factor 4-like protein 1